MPAKDPHLSVAWTMGKITGRALRGISGLWDTTRKITPKIPLSLIPQQNIENTVNEALSGFNLEQQELTLQEYDRRLKAMSEAIRALQEKIAELQLSGSLNAQTMAQAIGSVSNDEHFSVDEKNIFATILKQNIVLQRPELVKAHAEDKNLIAAN